MFVDQFRENHKLHLGGNVLRKIWSRGESLSAVFFFSLEFLKISLDFTVVMNISVVKFHAFKVCTHGQQK